MSLIQLIPVNESFFKIQAEQATLRELHEYFTITIPNTQSWRKKWNGEVRLFNYVTKQLYKGLLPSLVDWAKTHNHEIDLAGLDKKSNIDMEGLKRVVKGFKLHADNKPLEPYEYQYTALLRALRDKRLLLLSPTGSGKSLIIYMVVRILQEVVQGKILILVPTTNLVSQIWGDFAEYSVKDKWSPLDHCHQIYQGQEKHTSKKIYISTWQSLKDMPRDYFTQFSVIIGDEAHQYSASCAKYIIGCCVNAQYRIGTTATLKDTKAHIMLLQGLFGSIYQTAKTKDLMEKEILSDLKIECILLKHPRQIQMNYRDEIEYLISHEKRNRFICNLALSLEGNTIVLFHYVSKHGKILYEMLQKKRKGKDVYFIAGEVEKDVREQIRKIIETKKNAIMVASFRTFSFGVNIKRLHNVIFASPSKDRIRIMQSIGRELRLHPTKQKAFLFDLADDLSYANYTYAHFVHRLKIYHHEQFAYNTHHVELKL